MKSHQVLIQQKKMEYVYDNVWHENIVYVKNI